MKVRELNRNQIIELKQNYYCNVLDNNASYGELAEIDNIVTDAEIFEYYDFMEFTEDDFCSSM